MKLVMMTICSRKAFMIYLLFSCLVPNSVAICQDQPGEAFFDLGIFAYEDKAYQSAEKHLLKAIFLEPDNPFYNYFLGKVYLDDQQLDKAKKFLNKAFQLNPVMDGIDYDLAWLAFKQSRFKKAAQLFTTIVDNDPLTKNILAFYYAGISFFECHQYDQAIKYLMKASERSPSIKPNSMFYCGICYYKQYKFDKSAQHFEYVLMYAKKQELIKHAEDWLKTIRVQQASEKQFDYLLKFSVQADDNVMIVSPDWISGDESDGAMQLYLSGKYWFRSENRHRFSLGLRYFQTRHQDLSEYDMTGTIIDVAYTYRMHLIRMGFNYVPSSYWLDNKKYLWRHQWKGYIWWEISDRLMNRLTYSCYIQNNDQNSDRDGHTHDLSSTFFYKFKKNQLNVMLDFSAEENHRSDVLFQYEQMAIELALTKKLLNSLTFNSNFEMSLRRHEQWNELGYKRKDIKYEWSCNISKPFLQKNMEIWFNYSYTKNDSILDPYDYRRNIVGISFVYHN